MKRLLFLAAAVPVVLSALAGCDPKGPPPPNPKTAADEAMTAVAVKVRSAEPFAPALR